MGMEKISRSLIAFIVSKKLYSRMSMPPLIQGYYCLELFKMNLYKPDTNMCMKSINYIDYRYILLRCSLVVIIHNTWRYRL
jgi:hypothetical protein